MFKKVLQLGKVEALRAVVVEQAQRLFDVFARARLFRCLLPPPVAPYCAAGALRRPAVVVADLALLLQLFLPSLCPAERVVLYRLAHASRGQCSATEPNVRNKSRTEAHGPEVLECHRARGRRW